MKTLGLTDEHVALLMSFFQRVSSIQMVKIYGSRAKGNYHERSDVDLVVYGEEMDRFMIADLLLDIQSSDLPYTVDLQHYDDIKNHTLREHIDRVGIVFYKRKI
ncbi:MAG: nucleotidyltransferase domain-containing protein [Gammaproteobacteria bacterium]|nr:nucleotidyltransferase domain-containing protein [Gammaproteobacteria bacterium]